MKDGIILIDKEIGMTSRSVDNQIQRLFHIKKVGHLGTLDPFASGLLIVAIGKGTKALPYMNDEEKTYVASIKLGVSTDSGDLTGNELERRDISSFNEEDIKDVFKLLIGESEQVVPLTSAVHVNGKRLYEYAHKGMDVDRPVRKIYIYDLKLLSYKEDIIEFEVTCSKGTYVRSLGEEIAKRLNNIGHLISLRRIKISNVFDISEAKKIKDIKEDDILNVASSISYPHIVIDDEKTLREIYNGNAIKLNSKEDIVLLVKRENDEDIALAVYNRSEGNIYKPQRGLF